jgi:rhodanese-related sulfurtransferase
MINVPLFILNQTFKLCLVITIDGGGKITIKKISVILVFALLILSTTGVLLTNGKESTKIYRNQNNKTENICDSPPIFSHLSYEPQSNDFGNMYEGETNSTTFEIWNSGCCTLYYTLNWNCNWVDAYPMYGDLYENDSETIYVNINTTGLEWGPYLCNITIDTNANDGNFTVTVNILPKNFTNINVDEARDFLNNTSNGIQIPIDVRTDDEWKIEHIDTPYPENPIHYQLLDLQNATKLQEFKEQYKGKEIIIYSESGNQSAIAAELLVNSNFFGKIYNMLGGIIAWKDAGYPTKSNQPPEEPIINGTTRGKVCVDYNYTFNATDPDGDYLYYNINWSDDTGEVLIGPYASGKEVTLNHTWFSEKIYTIKAKAIDRYNDESVWDYLEVNITKNKEVNKPIINFLEKYPYVYLILRYLLRF